MTIGSRIREERKKLGLTQPELAMNIGMSLNSIKQLETDRMTPSIETLEKLCRVFNVSSDYILGLDNGVKSHILDEIVKKYDLDLSIPGQREKLEKLIEIVILDVNNKGDS